MDADNIDGAIRIFNPDIDLTDVRPRTVPRSHVAFLGEVLDKAALFVTRGYAATSLQGIAKEIKLSQTSIHCYFPSREALPMTAQHPGRC